MKADAAVAAVKRTRIAAPALRVCRNRLFMRNSTGRLTPLVLTPCSREADRRAPCGSQWCRARGIAGDRSCRLEDVPSRSPTARERGKPPCWQEGIIEQQWLLRYDLGVFHHRRV